eukprot:5126390-Prymnesium_polylepis.1
MEHCVMRPSDDGGERGASVREFRDTPAADEGQCENEARHACGVRGGLEQVCCAFQQSCGVGEDERVALLQELGIRALSFECLCLLACQAEPLWDIESFGSYSLAYVTHLRGDGGEVDVLVS